MITIIFSWTDYLPQALILDYQGAAHLLFQTSIDAQSIYLSINLSAFFLKHFFKIFGGLKFFSWIFNFFFVNFRNIFKILIIHKPFLGSSEVSQIIWARSVQPCWLYWIQTNRQTFRKAIFIYSKMLFKIYQF